MKATEKMLNALVEMGLSVTIIDDVPVFVFDDFAVAISSGEKMRKRVNAQQMIAYLHKIL